MNTYLPISVSEDSTVVAVFDPPKRREESYQSESDLERALIKQLQSQEYDYLPIKDVAGLKSNLRRELEALNDIRFSDTEWHRFLTQQLLKRTLGVSGKTEVIQSTPAALDLERDDGTHKNIHLLDKVNIHRNHLQVINQYEVKGNYRNRYDVTILVNGLPLVHLELKRRGVALREAFNQINRYQRDSFWADSGLFEYVQIFVISNGTLTKYYANTTRMGHLREQAETRNGGVSASFEFTSWWTDARNQRIIDLVDFAKTFLSKRTLLNVISKYCVFTVDRDLMVMRPYQIVAAERIINRIQIASNYRKLGRIEAGGYVWHTTGSGKTLTSFKTAQLATQIEGVDKVLFVVDRKDLDYQTKREYEKFQKGAVNSNKSTAELARQLGNPQAKIVITTIQKLSRFINANKAHQIFDAHVVIIFDECHRSQFGDMHRGIKKAFRNYHLFGFTGTPIFNENKGAGNSTAIRTTAQVFGDRLHEYTITDAITDGNVLHFSLDYHSTIKAKEGIKDKKVPAIDTEDALLDARRVQLIVSYVLEHFDQKTKRNTCYPLKGKRLRGFNSIFACASVLAAKTYYSEFVRQQAELPPDQRLKIATIFTYAANSDQYSDGLLPDEDFDSESLDKPDRDFLESAISDYNELFQTNFDASAGNFGNYYEDVSQRLRNRELDMLIVVNMFLTGFDAKTLNTLWVDKPLRHHGLLQAYSRTNRILNSVKNCGNIITFRNLQQETDEALALFGNKDAQGIAVLKPFGHYFEQYQTVVNELRRWEPGSLPASETEQEQFIQTFGGLLRLRNILQVFDEFEEQDPLSARDLQDYQSVYLELYRARRRNSDEAEEINDDLTFEIELIKHVEVNVDYILMLVEKYREQHEARESEEVRAEILRAVKSSPTLQNKLDLIEQFLEKVSPTGDVGQEWREYIEEQKELELTTLVAEENLKPDATKAFVEAMFRRGRLETGGIEIENLLPNVPLFGAAAEDRASLRQRVAEKLQTLFDRFYVL